jgi:dihydroorotate dehydrogenase (fumarate)
MRTEAIYAGLKLRTPIVAGSSGLTNSAKKNSAAEKAGAGAIVLKSLFEEQILMDTGSFNTHEYPEAEDYLKNYLRAGHLTDYLNLIRDTKQVCSIPIIGSINCYSSEGWIDFAHKIESAGVDALELNIFSLNTSKQFNVEEYIKLYIDIVRKVKAVVSVPIIVKIGQNHSNIVWLIEQLRLAGASAVVLFNRFYQPDIDIQEMKVNLTDVFSDPSEMYTVLRWVGIVSGKIPEIDVIASTGMHALDAPIKAILAGASAVQVCSAIYKNDLGIISQMNTVLDEWMEKNGFASVAEFKGKLNYTNIDNPMQYERTQFLNYVTSKGVS